jgi:hypothetical protein
LEIQPLPICLARPRPRKGKNQIKIGDFATALSSAESVASTRSRRSCCVAVPARDHGLGLSANPYLLNSTFQLALGGDVDWSDAWFSHPDGFGNTLVVDGQTIANGSRHFYDAVGCPGL